MRQVHGTSLWIGNAGDLRKPASIFDKGIEAVIDVAEEEPVSTLPRSLMYFRLPLADDASNTNWKVELAIEKAANLLQREVPTLIACSAGLSRSLCVAAGAIARVRRIDPHEALAKVIESGPADISPGFWEQVACLVSVPSHDDSE
ncbi:MAG: dual specificity protein phosphatase family protein [Planctomycetaceae bacterium]|nr:dual specificity protein phosphatase family protein [Planctomycetaceae bacterium]